MERRGREGMEKDRRVESSSSSSSSRICIAPITKRNIGAEESGKRQVPPASGPRSAHDTIRDVTVRIGWVGE